MFFKDDLQTLLLYTNSYHGIILLRVILLMFVEKCKHNTFLLDLLRN